MVHKIKNSMCSRIITDPEKHTICDYIRDGPHRHNPSLGTFNHYAVILPSGKHSSWWTKVALGTNSNICHRGMPSKHAEIDAIEKIRKWKNLPDSIDIFVIRLTKTGILTESRPCIHCIIAMLASRLAIRNVYYSNRAGKIVMERMVDMIHSPVKHVSSGMRTRQHSFSEKKTAPSEYDLRSRNKRLRRHFGS